MLCVVVANPKGGCGKTTVATNLAAAFAVSGFSTALADVDRQKAALAWAGRRPGRVARLTALDWAKDVSKVPKGVERLVVDTPASLRLKQMDDILALADLLVLPVQPSVFDQGATARFLERLETVKRVRKARTLVAVVGNRLRPRTRAAGRLDRFLATLGQTVVTRLRDNALYADLAVDGLGIYDLGGRRGETCRADWQPLLDMIAGRAEAKEA